MLPFNPEFQSGESKITQVRLSVLLASGVLLNMTEEHVMLGGFSRDSSTTVDGQFTVGAAVTGKLTVVIDNTNKAYSSYDFRSAVITARLGGQLSDGTYQLVQVGIYTVDDYVYNGSTITLTAYDNLKKFDLPCKTNGSQPTYPTTLAQMVNLACSAAGVTLANVSIPNGTYSITKAPEAWDTMTWHDVIAYCAQIACCWAKVLPNGNLFLAWYDTSPFNSSQLDGGTFNTNTTPYSDGAVADGGDFTYGTTTSYDGGSFGDRDNAHYLGLLYDLTIDTDDVQITGVIVTLDPSNNIDATDDTEVYTAKLGTDGYIITIENNPLIETTANADAVATYLYNIIVGIRFRPLNATIVENPAVEAGDVALVIDREDNTYTCFLSHVIYTTNASTSISCDAAKTTQNLKARYGEIEKTRALTQRVYNKAMSNAEDAMFTITTAIATTMGLYPYPVSDGQGGTIYIFGNKNTLASSDIRWRFSAGALMVSDDYGAKWNGAISSAGQAVLQEVYAVKVNADNILAGTMTIGGTSGNKDGSLIIKDSNGNTIGTFNKNGISVKGSIQSGSSISGSSISGSDITIGGSNVAGSLVIKDANGNTLVSMNKNGASFKGSINSGSSISGSSISGGTISGATVSGNTITGGSINIGNSTFVVNTSGNLNCTSVNLQGSIKSNTSSYGNSYVSLDDGDIEFGSATYSGKPSINAFTSDNRMTLQITNGHAHPIIIGSSPVRCGLEVWGNFTCHNTKSRVVEDTIYGSRKLYAYETPTPYFGDIGSGVIDDNGEVLIGIDDIFDETINTSVEYVVFLQKEGQGDLWIKEKSKDYFIVNGTPNLRFSWELKAVQRHYEYYRLDDYELEKNDYSDEQDVGLSMEKDLKEIDNEELFTEELFLNDDLITYAV